MPLLVFEFLGTTELMVIALVALIIFGPRKLPEIGRTIGKGMAEFKRASEDFRRTWEYEVEVERRQVEPAPEPEAGAARGQLAEESAGESAAGEAPSLEDWTGEGEPLTTPEPAEQTIARNPSGGEAAQTSPEHGDAAPDEFPERERA
jgi:TatA/E family protein of Tat protein translocase